MIIWCPSDSVTLCFWESTTAPVYCKRSIKCLVLHERYHSNPKRSGDSVLHLQYFSSVILGLSMNLYDNSWSCLLIDIGWATRDIIRQPVHSLSKSKDFHGIVPSIFDSMNHQYLSSWGHSRLVITNKKILI